MSFNPVGASCTPTYIQQLSFDLQSMKKKAEVFAKQHPYNDKKILEYINNILDDKTFQTNPKGYLNEWRERRGSSEDRRMPEDQALGFFRTNFKF